MKMTKTIENVHQNGINALLSFKDHSEVVTGGDDGKMVITTFLKSTNKSIQSHSAAHITAIKEVGIDDFCCVSVDQRLSFYTQELELKHQIFSHCPDIADAVWIENENTFIVVGSNSLERFSIN